MKCIIGKKLGMTTLYDEAKGALPITLVECVPSTIVSKRTPEKDGYSALIVESAKNADVQKKEKSKQEFRTENQSEVPELNATMTVETFAVGESVIIQGTTKGKGFQGVMKRHGFHGSPASHGHRHDHRAPGSIGSAFPQHVLKGKKMAGRMGNDKHTVRNVEIVMIDAQKQILGIKGAVPGAPGGMVKIMSA